MAVYRDMLWVAICLYIAEYMWIVNGRQSACRREKIAGLKKKQTICEYHLEISEKFTMVSGSGHHGYRVIPDCLVNRKWLSNSKCAACPVNSDCAGTQNSGSFDDVISADGIFRKVIAVNGKMPGPRLDAKEGAHMVVHVTNKLLSRSITVHWHGMHQRNNFYMDGVPFITQCPIETGQTFTYRFLAKPAGTHWYHGHVGAQSADGFSGPFVIHKAVEPSAQLYDYKPVKNHRIRPPPKDITMVIQDWQHKTAEELLLQADGGGGFSQNPFFPTKMLNGTAKTSDGSSISHIPYISGLINGRMQFDENWVPNTRWPIRVLSNLVPYTEFKVHTGKKYRFRIIGAMFQFAYMVSIDKHLLKVIAVDGQDINPIIVDSIVIHPGERYDVVVHMNQINVASAFWIKATNLEYNSTNVDFKNQDVLAILKYPKWNARPYIFSYREFRFRTPRILNCPVYVNYFGRGERKSLLSPMCIKVSELTSLNSTTDENKTNLQRNTELLFFNFANGPDEMSAVNGKRFRNPTGFSGDRASNANVTPCPAECSLENITTHKGCHCAHMIELRHKQVYMFVFVNMGTTGKVGMARPIHMHGHHFHVLKMVYPELDEYGIYKRASDDICCPCPDDQTKCCTNLDERNLVYTTSTNGKVFCKNPRWRNVTWDENPTTIQGLNQANPPLKDTVIVPSGGYVVVAFEADNPGRWMLHSQLIEDRLHGMSVLLMEGISTIPQPPPGMPTCSDFRYIQDDYFAKIRNKGRNMS